jgi:hypothetical protein
MDRFITNLGTLIIMLSLLILGIVSTLDRLERQPSQGHLATYGPKGREMTVYTGDTNHLAQMAKMDSTQLPRYLRRVRAPIPATSYDGARWL